MDQDHIDILCEVCSRFIPQIEYDEHIRSHRVECPHCRILIPQPLLASHINVNHPSVTSSRPTEGANARPMETANSRPTDTARSLSHSGPSVVDVDEEDEVEEMGDMEFLRHIFGGAQRRPEEERRSGEDRRGQERRDERRGDGRSNIFDSFSNFFRLIPVGRESAEHIPTETRDPSSANSNVFSMVENMVRMMAAAGGPFTFYEEGGDQPPSPPTGLTPQQISRLPEEYFVSRPNLAEEFRSCIICYEDFDSSSLLRRLPCFHVYHKDCIDSWFKKSKECPICKCSCDI